MDKRQKEKKKERNLTRSWGCNPAVDAKAFSGVVADLFKERFAILSNVPVLRSVGCDSIGTVAKRIGRYRTCPPNRGCILRRGNIDDCLYSFRIDDRTVVSPSIPEDRHSACRWYCRRSRCYDQKSPPKCWNRERRRDSLMYILEPRQRKSCRRRRPRKWPTWTIVP